MIKVYSSFHHKFIVKKNLSKAGKEKKKFIFKKTELKSFNTYFKIKAS